MRRFAYAVLPFALVTGAAHAQSGGPLTVQQLTITGPGSTGDVSGMSVTPTGRTVATTQADRAAKRKLISDYGPAAGNGTNATDAFTAAMADTTSPTIYIPEGIYTLVGCPNFSAESAVSFVGAGAGRTVIQLANAGSVCSNMIFSWPDQENVQVRELTLDLKDATALSEPPQISVLLFKGAKNLVVDGIEIKGVKGPFWTPINVAGGTGGRITNNTIIMTGTDVVIPSGPLAGKTQFAQAISMARNEFFALTDWTVSGNRMEGAGFAATPTARLRVTNNDISKWHYGGGITIADNLGAFTDVIVDGNMIHDSGSIADKNNTIPSGVENWGAGSLTTNNTIWNVGSNCVFLGGVNSYATGNKCRRWSAGGPGGGYTAYQLWDRPGQRLMGNVAQADGSAFSRYGVQDRPRPNPSTPETLAVVGPNIVSASVSPYRILGWTVVSDTTVTTTVANLGVCGTANEGSLMAVSDATSNVRGATLTGGGALYALAQCNGTGWKAY